MTPHEFLEQLWADKPSDLYLLIWTLQDKRSRWFQKIEEAAAFAASCQHMDVYVGVGLSPRDYGPSRRCPSEEIACIGGLWADFDLQSEAHKKALPATIPDALSIIPAGMPPTIVVATGNGAHAWWLFKEPFVFENDQEREDAARLIARWHTLLRLNAAARGWAFDRLSDLARVLRIPGTINGKDPANPKQVTVDRSTDRRYNFCDFEEVLDESAIPDPEAEERAAREWAERFKDKPLVIDAAARIPQELLDGWMAQDMRFQNTWLRQRHDLKDQSQSGYDLALADFGVEAGLAEQQIVDLIVHHRSLYAQKQRTRIDYFQRTIAKAYRQGSTIDPPQAAPDAREDRPTGGSSMPGPELNKALLCEQISRVLGVRVVRLVKITGKEPAYHMELEDAKIEFPHVGKLISQEAVRVAIAAAVGKLIPRIKPKHWEQLAQVMLDACIVEQGSIEMEWDGASRTYVAQYLAETGFIESIDGQTVQNQRKPMVIDGRIAINASDLQVYVNKTTFQNLSVKAIASMLAVMGGKQMRVRGQRFREQSRWLLPIEQFDPSEYSARGGEKTHAGE
jgi:hypothetical protein